VLWLPRPVHRLAGPGEFDDPVAFDRHLAGDGLLGFGDLLVAALVGGAGRPWLGEYMPVGDVASGWSFAIPV